MTEGGDLTLENNCRGGRFDTFVCQIPTYPPPTAGGWPKH